MEDFLKMPHTYLNMSSPSAKQTILIITPHFKEPTAWMISAYKTAIGLAQQKGVRASKAYERINNISVYRTKGYYLSDPVNYVITPHLFRDLNILMNKERPDHIIISKYMFFTSLSALWLKKHKKHFVIQTDTFPGYCWFTRSWIVNVVMWLYTRTIGIILLRSASRVWLLHQGLLPWANKLKLQSEVIHNGVDVVALQKAKPAQDLLAYKQDCLLVTFLGRLDAVKGYLALLSIAKAAQKNPLLKGRIRFVYVCSDKHPKKRKMLEQQYPYIKFTGFRNDVESVWKATDIHVLASYDEGLPNSVMEAMAAGCAVISTPVGGVPYLIQDGKNGVLAEHELLLNALERVVLDKQLRNHIRKHAPSIICSEYNWSSLPKHILKTLKNNC
jgi:glycosyltransferase involved in cell wall biosynthesis